jgi:predicted nucleic acid-binding protein
MFVVDASMALTWCIEDEATDSSDHVLHRLLIEGGIAPAQWPLEMANGIRYAARRGRVDEPAVGRARAIIAGLPIEVLPVETSTALGLIDVAQALDLSVYDAAYLELARVRGLGLATLDMPLAAACRKAGIAVIAA